jgi:hypothetical protein
MVPATYFGPECLAGVWTMCANTLPEPSRSDSVCVMESIQTDVTFDPTLAGVRLIARVFFQVRKDRWQPTRVDLQRADGAPLDAAFLHALGWGGLFRQAQTEAFTPLLSRMTDGRLPPPTKRARGGRPPKYKPEHFEKVARVYSEAFAAGTQTVAPTVAVRKRFRVSYAAAAKWVARCRQMGLLPPTERGKASAALIKRTRTRRRKA